MIPQENKLLHLLSNQDVTFYIPPYQRNYEWTDEQCQVFWDDVIKTYHDNISGMITEHFFGSVTFFQSETPFGQPNKLVLIDGQQRVTTTMLFLVALRDILEDAGLKNFINSRYLQNNNTSGDGEYKIKLKQVESDWGAYKKIILSEELSREEKTSSVYRNYQFFCNKLNARQEKGENLAELIDKGIAKFSVITIELQPSRNKWENPQEIFESMNSLGKPLSLADLVRNYLLLGLDAKVQDDLYNRYWLHIERTIPKKVSDFIRDYMQSVKKCGYPKSSESNYKLLYSQFKKIFDCCDSESMLKDLAEYADIYAFIIFDKTTGNKEIDKLIADLRKINITTAYSFLLSLLHEWKKGKFSSKDVIELLDAFKIYCYRKRILGLTQTENQVFPTFSAKIDSFAEAKDKREYMFDLLSKQENRMRLPNDIELTRSIETMNFFNFRHSKLLLAMIEETLTKSRPDMTDAKLQVEHIMPQTLNNIWKKALGENYEEIHQTYVHNIGNLTLIRHNQQLGQKPFEEKAKVYDNNAGLQIARTHITNNCKWSEQEIKTRSEWMIRYLLEEVLPIPESKKKTNNYSIRKSNGLSFQELGLIGAQINFIEDKSIVVRVVSDKEVEFEGKKFKLSSLTRELKTRSGTVNLSGSYRGAAYWEYDGIKLADMV